MRSYDKLENFPLRKRMKNTGSTITTNRGPWCRGDIEKQLDCLSTIAAPNPNWTTDMKLSKAEIKDNEITLKFDFRTYGIGDDITMSHDLKMWSSPKQVCEDLINTANGIIDTLDLNLELKTLEKRSNVLDNISEQDLADRWG